jgi:hypothetical protein
MPSIQPAVNLLQSEVKALDEVYNKEQGSDITELLITIDGNRDSDLTGIKTVCEGYIYSRNEAVSKAAKRIVENINGHGKGITRMNYQAQTQVIKAIITDWKETEELSDALETLNLSGWASALETENNNFSQTYQQRVDDKLETEGLSFSELRTNGITTYKALTDTIFAYSIIEKEESYYELAKAINLIVNDYKAILDRREAIKETGAQI